MSWFGWVSIRSNGLEQKRWLSQVSSGLSMQFARKGLDRVPACEWRIR
jgi:hypothetical protein